ncbi:hypothetical protein [Anaerosporobacter faecicola]|uniref:hypothetical protein n=1 Tax=Anaerosporobacter faecicola TaxID=2718714 RepID=UPI001438EE20|nr:hypothetical protein [Anaerosporobacter faecicola]
MQIGINLATARFKNEVIKLVNESGLPPTIASVVLGEVKGTVDIQADKVIAAEEKKYNEDLAKESEKDGEEICKA